jgi:hypothetical protein
MTDQKDYKIGYGKPPKHTQFTPGVSGNSKGKPRKNKTFEEEVQAVLGARVPVIINGKKTYVTKRQLLLEQIVNAAINKNPTMARLALPLLKLVNDTPAFEILPEDKKALKALLENFAVDGSEKS